VDSHDALVGTLRGAVILLSRIQLMRALIVGAGIAGLSSAYWLRRAGIEVVVIERSPGPRESGFLIDLFGPGYTVAEEMRVMGSLKSLQRRIQRCAFMDPCGTTLFSQSPDLTRRRLFADRHVVATRGDLERLLLDRVRANSEIRFARSLLALRDEGPRVGALTDDRRMEYFDLVIGAGGLHSPTRRLALAQTDACERYLGYDVAAFTLQSPRLCEMVGAESQSMTALGRQLTISPLGDGRLSAVFVYAREETLRDRRTKAVRSALRAAFAKFEWIVPALIDRITEATDLHYDAVAQIALREWSVGRIVLVGDACHGVSPMGLPGASLAMTGARILASQLANAGNDVVRGLRAYEHRMRPVVRRAQVAGQRMARWVAPGTKMELAARDFAIRAAGWPIGAAVMRRALGVENARGGANSGDHTQDRGTGA
jgi:2-polyprenyl-6-methoxyphenol hydroxylase-like FAD-dependent oxidoreductase